jgi:hypothetical protein
MKSRPGLAEGLVIGRLALVPGYADCISVGDLSPQSLPDFREGKLSDSGALLRDETFFDLTLSPPRSTEREA